MKKNQNRGGQEDTYVKYIKMYIHLYNKGYKRLGYFMYWLNRIVFSCDIPCTVSIGQRIHLPHFGLGVVIHPKAVIGNDVTIYQQVTIGARNGSWHVVIGDNVVLGAGCKIIGTLTIGNNCRIGANSVVLKSIPDGSTAVGIPAHIILRR